MQDHGYALVLTGELLRGHAPETAWPALAATLQLDQARVDTLRARAPLSIKQGQDLGRLQALQAHIASVGVETELCALDARPALFVLLDGKPRGPLPRAFIDEKIDHGLWPSSPAVAEVGSQHWQPLQPPAPAPPPPGIPEPADTGPVFEAREAAPAPQPATGFWALLPVGPAIHAGFWRRAAAMVLDGLIIGVAMVVLQLAVDAALLDGLAVSATASFVVTALMFVIAFVGQWLYFARFESSGWQATPGKRALGLKVVEGHGQRIGFGRASGRYFGKVLSSLILNIGFLLAAWTSRKQALHDMLAGTFVVFNTVEPGQPLPRERPPMPWHGWLLNLALIATPVLIAIASMRMAGLVP